MKWKRAVGWTFTGVITLVLMVAVGGYLYLQSTGFQRFAIAKIVEQANLASGGRTEIRGLDFTLSTLTANLYDITVHGTEGPDQPPLLHADKLTVRLKIQSVLRRKITVRELLLEHPVVRLEVNRQGTNNLPQAPPSQNGSSTNVSDLAVGHVSLTNGEVNYNDKKTRLEADLYNLGTDIRFEMLARRYEGKISYDNGHLRYAEYSPLGHNLELRFTASPDRFVLDSAVLKVGAFAVTLHGQVADYSNPVADGDYDIRIHTQDFDAMAKTVAPTGDVVLAGKMHYQRMGDEPLLRAVALDGKIASELVTAAASGRRVELRSLQGQYRLSRGTLQITDFHMDSLGGRISSKAEIQHLDTVPVSRVQASFRNISLAAVQSLFKTPKPKGASISGTVNGTANASWKGSFSDLYAHSDLSVRAAARRSSNTSGNVPVDGTIHLAYDGSRQSLMLHDTRLRTPAATLTAQGEVSQHSNLQIQMSASNLHELAALASSFSAYQSAPPEISGSASLNAVVHGSTTNPVITGQLTAKDLQVQGSEWTTARLGVQASPSQLVVKNGLLTNAHQGEASFQGSIGLKNWAYEVSSPIRADLSVQRLRVSDLQRLANQHYPISGDLSAKLSLQGSQLNPAGSGSVQIANARAYDEPVQNLALKFQADNGTIVSTLNLATSAGSLDANVSYTPRTKAYKVKLDAPAVVLQKLQTVQAKNLPLTGTLNASVTGEGTLDDPRLNAVLQLPQLQLRQSSITGLRAEVHIADHRANLDVDSKVSQASVRAHGRVDLTGAYYTEAAVDTSAVPLDLLVATFAHGAPEGFQGQTELHATLRGPLKDKSQLEAHLSIPVLNASYQSLQIGIAEPIRADYANSVITLQPTEIRGTGTSLHVQGKFPLARSAVAPTLTAQGSVDVRILRIVAPDVESSGNLALDVRTSGYSSGAAVQGQVRLQNVALATADAPLGVSKLNGTLDLDSDRVQISNMTGEVGGGQVSVGGSIAYRPSLQFNIALQAQSVRLRYPDGLRTLLEGNLAFSGTAESSTLNGRVLLDSLTFTPDFDFAKFGDQFSTGATAPSQPGFADTVRLAIGVQSKENLNATSSEVSIAGRVALQVIGTVANPVITGRTNLTSGELFYRNVRYQLQRGVITFDDPNETHPVMNLTVATTVEQYNLTLTMRGPLDKLTTSYVSDPPLATADIINLIARGKTTQESNATSTSTDSMIASQAASQLSGSVQKLAGISSLQIDPLIGSNNQNPSARVAIQQRVTKNLLFTFSTDVSQPGSEMVQGDYQVNKHWSVSMARDQLGGVSVDGKFHTRF
jgi:translocation and assembly module TamB